jgi:metal-dependent hydrolase (beta-lactamase superfamily II)
MAAIGPAALVPAHCTGQAAVAALAAAFPDAYITNSVGTRYDFLAA